jgi:hypothetical protein
MNASMALPGERVSGGSSIRAWNKGANANGEKLPAKLRFCIDGPAASRRPVAE